MAITFNNLPNSEKLHHLSGIYGTMKKYRKECGYIGFDGEKMWFSDEELEGFSLFSIEDIQAICILLESMI